MAVYLIHNRPDLLDECCDLINSEWPRSKTARMRSLLSSKDDLPTNLILIENTKVIGHSKLTPIPNISDACFVESVVIHQNFRGKGFGKLLMNKCEEYAKGIGLHIVYLSTFDQEGFYKKLGYEKCQPISIYGSCNITSCMPAIFTKCMRQSNSLDDELAQKIKVLTTKSSPQTQHKQTPPPPPPPPPPSKQTTKNVYKVFLHYSKTKLKWQIVHKLT